MEESELDYYISIGAIQLEGIDEDGEFMFSVTKLAKEIAPELWQAHKDHIDTILLELYEKGLINISYNEELDALIELTEQGRKEIENRGMYPMSEEGDDN